MCASPLSDDDSIPHQPKLFPRRSFLKLAAAAVPLAALPALRSSSTAAAALPTSAAAPAVDGLQRFGSRPDLAPVTLTVQGNASLPDGLSLFLTDGGPMILDNAGRLVWYREFGDGKRFATNFRAQRYRGQDVLTWFEGVGEGTHTDGDFVIADASYQELFRLSARGGYGDGHDFLITPDDHALVTVYPPIPVDLSMYGGPRDGVAVDGVVQEIDLATGEVVFEWKASEHVPFEATYVTAPTTRDTQFDYFHINGIALDDDGALIVSARHTWSVYKVERPSGRVVWTLGGARSDFAMGEGAAFAWQHNAHRLANGDIALFDNEASPAIASQSRGLVLHLDETQMRADLVQEFRHPDGLLSNSQGSIQQLPNGEFLVGWGAQPVVTCFRADGTVEFDARLGKGQSYRAFAMPWHATPLDRPALTVWPAANGATVTVSWNGATEVASWQIYAGVAPDQMSAVADLPRAGFESRLDVRSEATYWFVEARNAEGDVLGVSRTVALAT